MVCATRLKSSCFFLFSLFFFTTSILATPSEIIIIRHGDKWIGKETGPYLSPKGQVRAEKFVDYYLSHFPKPNYMFASKPNLNDSENESNSVRPWQTLMPLANQLTFMTRKSVVIETPYYQNQYEQLANTLLHNKKYDQKIILICWQHGRINFLAHDLGVTQSLQKWANNNYDSVYVIHYEKNAFKNIDILNNQYPVTTDPTWNQLATTR